MLTPMDILPWLLAGGVIALIWWDALGAKIAARRAARHACEDAEVRFIDELALRRLTLKRVHYRGGHRAWHIRRVFRFEFYWSGDTRHTGHVVMHGQRVASVQLDPYPL